MKKLVVILIIVVLVLLALSASRPKRDTYCAELPVAGCIQVQTTPTGRQT